MDTPAASLDVWWIRRKDEVQLNTHHSWSIRPFWDGMVLRLYRSFTRNDSACVYCHPRRRQWRRVGFLPPFVCLSVCLIIPMTSRKTMQLRSQTWHKHVLRCVVETHLFWGSKRGQMSRSLVAQTLPAWIFALLWVLASCSFVRQRFLQYFSAPCIICTSRSCQRLQSVTLMNCPVHWGQWFCKLGFYCASDWSCVSCRFSVWNFSLSYNGSWMW